MDNTVPAPAPADAFNGSVVAYCPFETCLSIIPQSVNGIRLHNNRVIFLGDIEPIFVTQLYEHMENSTRSLPAAARESLIGWRSMIAGKDFTGLPSIVAADAVFYSPVEWHGYPGRDIVCLLLSTAAGVYEDFTYKTEFTNGDSVILGFDAHIGDILVSGIHIIRFNAAGEFVHIEKMLRPEEGVKALGHAMCAKVGAQANAALLKLPEN